MKLPAKYINAKIGYINELSRLIFNEFLESKYWKHHKVVFQNTIEIQYLVPFNNIKILLISEVTVRGLIFSIRKEDQSIFTIKELLNILYMMKHVDFSLRDFF